MKETGIILDELYFKLEHEYDELRHHPYVRDWIEIRMKRSYLSMELLKNIEEVCLKHNLKFHAVPIGRIFKKIIICIHDKEE